mmetsp:Transcript_10819/g.19753  ORF Transcript_10819/g.19753 Transcript_10819/m.19753 type:complete len:422 (-) Transcript_10819:212-1477(-)|eukprot:CAMPEP_0197515126 /NCGR_PEP_ID=MMETSP1318-20131121/350_1 /TAXON_ID=552666 /ORGANISM="Partenskyella glossopodia, Strain RCC365" /LENGTH=421 /DNA_ID=CAMNT_0043063409 /DNA_START=190 /DNA_END=1455 /DNA_ORIENTATION=+
MQSHYKSLGHNNRSTKISVAVLLLAAIGLSTFAFTSNNNGSLSKPWWKFGRGGKDKKKEQQNNAAAGAAVPQQSYAIEVQSQEHFISVFKNGTTHDTVIIDFYGNNCPYCVQIAPFYDRLALEYKDYATFLKINVQKLPALAEGVEGLPTFLFICRGESLGQLPGADPKALLQVTVEAIKKCAELAKQPKVELQEVCPVSEKFEADVNYYGGTIQQAQTRVKDKESCCGVCAIVPECKGFTFQPDPEKGDGMCFPKSQLNNKVKSDSSLGYVSGEISDVQRQEVVDRINSKYRSSEGGSGASGGAGSARRPDPKAELPQATCKFEANMDYTGNDLDYGNLKRKDKQACCDYCAASSDCKGFTYMEDPEDKGEGWCFLKSSNSGKRQADPRMRLTSGIVVSAGAEASAPAGQPQANAYATAA